jgi:hypothetical protein
MTIFLMALTATALAYGLKRIWPDDVLLRIVLGCLVMIAVF